MAGRYAEYGPNVVDFIEYKLKQHLDDAVKANRQDVAEAVWNALSAYMAGDIDIVFAGGLPHMSPGPNAKPWPAEVAEDVPVSASAAPPSSGSHNPPPMPW